MCNFGLNSYFRYRHRPVESRESGQGWKYAGRLPYTCCTCRCRLVFLSFILLSFHTKLFLHIYILALFLYFSLVCFSFKWSFVETFPPRTFPPSFRFVWGRGFLNQFPQYCTANIYKLWDQLVAKCYAKAFPARDKCAYITGDEHALCSRWMH